MLAAQLQGQRAQLLAQEPARGDEAIVAWREQHGPFRSLDDLAKVRGIGPRTIEANRAVVVIGPIMPPGDKSG